MNRILLVNIFLLLNITNLTAVVVNLLCRRVTFVCKVKKNVTKLLLKFCSPMLCMINLSQVYFFVCHYYFLKDSLSEMIVSKVPCNSYHHLSF